MSEDWTLSISGWDDCWTSDEVWTLSRTGWVDEEFWRYMNEYTGLICGILCGDTFCVTFLLEGTMKRIYFGFII